MTNDNDHTMSRAEFDAMREGATPFYYSGDHQTIASLSARPDGLSLSLTCFESDGEPQMSTMIPWAEFARIAADIPFIVASGAASRDSGRSTHIGPPAPQDAEAREVFRIVDDNDVPVSETTFHYQGAERSTVALFQEPGAARFTVTPLGSDVESDVWLPPDQVALLAADLPRVLAQLFGHGRGGDD